MNKISLKLVKLSIAGGALASGLLSKTVFGATDTPGTGLTYPSVPELRQSNITQTILTVVTWGLAIAGTVAVLFLIVGGFLYITSAGDEQRIQKAKDTLKSAIIGIVFILLALVIVITLNEVLATGQY